MTRHLTLSQIARVLFLARSSEAREIEDAAAQLTLRAAEALVRVDPALRIVPEARGRGEEISMAFDPASGGAGDPLPPYIVNLANDLTKG